MTVKMRLIIAILLVAALVFIARSIIKKRMDVRYALIWMLMLVMIGLFDLFPGLLEIMSDFMGVALPVNMLFFLGFCFALIVIYRITVWIYNLSNEVRRLTQEVGILKHELEAYRKAEGADMGNTGLYRSADGPDGDAAGGSGKAGSAPGA